MRVVHVYIISTRVYIYSIMKKFVSLFVIACLSFVIVSCKCETGEGSVGGGAGGVAGHGGEGGTCNLAGAGGSGCVDSCCLE